MNRYITLLIIIMTAYGSGAETLKSAIAVSGCDISLEETENLKQLQVNGADIMSVLKLLRIGTNHNIGGSEYDYLAALASNPYYSQIRKGHQVARIIPSLTYFTLLKSSNSIRAPSRYSI